MCIRDRARVLSPSLEVVGSSDHLRQLDRRQNYSVPPFAPGGTHVSSFGFEAPVNRPASDTRLLQRQPTADVQGSSATGDHTYAEHSGPPVTSDPKHLAPTPVWFLRGTTTDTVSQPRLPVQADGINVATGIHRVDSHASIVSVNHRTDLADVVRSPGQQGSPIVSEPASPPAVSYTHLTLPTNREV